MFTVYCNLPGEITFGSKANNAHLPHRFKAIFLDFHFVLTQLTFISTGKLEPPQYTALMGVLCRSFATTNSDQIFLVFIVKANSTNIFILESINQLFSIIKIYNDDIIDRSVRQSVGQSVVTCCRIFSGHPNKPCLVADLGEGPGGHPTPLFWVKKKEMTEGKKASRASKIKPGPLLISKSRSASDVFRRPRSTFRHLARHPDSMK